MLKPSRLHSIDMLRGFVIALMALDHTRDYFGFASFDPEDLSLTTPAWFWTRWITHLCATVFVLLAGSSAFLRGQASGIPDLSRYLFTRGLMLLALEATWISFSWQFGYQVLILQVLWALGVGMVVLSALIWLPRWAIALFAALMILPHNLLDAYHPHSIFWNMWHERGFYRFPDGSPLDGIMFAYPLMPWLGLIAAGYALGPVFRWEPVRRQRFLLGAAGLLLAVFAALRSLNIYGDPDPWSAQHHGLMFDAMSFMRVHKYPPSLLYLCVTVAMGMLLLVLFERIRTNKVQLTFGRAPLPFYVIHIAVIHLLGNLYFMARWGSVPTFANGKATWPDGYVPSLAVVYLAWIFILALMYGILLLWQRVRRPAAAQASTPAQSAGSAR